MLLEIGARGLIKKRNKGLLTNLCSTIKSEKSLILQENAVNLLSLVLSQSGTPATLGTGLDKWWVPETLAGLHIFMKTDVLRLS